MVVLVSFHGQCLPDPGASRYQRILPQYGHFHSTVLGLDLAIIGNTLRFLSGSATLPLSADEGLKEALFTILDLRAIPCTDEARARIASCADPATLRRWLLQSKTATTLEQALSPSA